MSARGQPLPPSPRRRGLLRGAGAALLVAFVPGCSLPVIPRRPVPDAEAAMGWIRHDGGGRFTLFLPRAEMGQQVTTALKQVACDELQAAWHEVTVRLPSTAEIARVRATVGSESMQAFALPLAQACATLRDALRAGVADSASLHPVERPYGQLLAFSRGSGDGTRRRLVGAEVEPEQARDIVLGRPLYAADASPPGRVYGRVLRAPVSPELPSRLEWADEAAARSVPGFVAVVRDDAFTLGQGEGLGVAASTPAALERVIAALAPRWSVEGRFDARSVADAIDIDARLAEGGRRDHEVVDGPAGAPDSWDVDLRVDVPLAAHAAIEPRAAVAEPLPEGGVHVRVGHQDVFYVRDVIARRLGLAADRVVVAGARIGGAFGGRTVCTVALEAAALARALGRPVKVQWTRAQEFEAGFHRPPSSHRVRARLSGGRVSGWQHDFASSNILLTNAVLPAWLQPVTAFVGDAGVARGAAPPYAVGDCRVGFDLVRLPVFTGPWRGLGAGPNGLAVESAIDECARLSDADPLAFRIAHATEPRLVRVLQRVARSCGWPRPAPPSPGARTGRGVACGIYKAHSYVAVVAEVSVPADTAGPARVTGLWCAHDSGRVIHPDHVRAQCEGNLVWGIGMVLLESLDVGESSVIARDFAGYRVPRIRDVPPLAVEIVEGDDPPSGAGETAIVAAGAAIANAIRDATGIRARRFPIRAGDLASASGRTG